MSDATDIARKLPTSDEVIAWLCKSADIYRAKGQMMDAAMMLGVAAHIARLSAALQAAREETDRLHELLEGALNFIDAQKYPSPDHELAFNLVEMGRAALRQSKEPAA